MQKKTYTVIVYGPSPVKSKKFLPAVNPGGGGGALGYFLRGYVPPGTPNWHFFLEKSSPKIGTPF